MLEGGCLCGAVRFQVDGPVHSAGFCHCTHCQKRTGTGSSANCRVEKSGFELLRGSEQLSSYQHTEGIPKWFCSNCGSALFSGDPFSDEQVKIRIGSFDADPGTRPEYRQFVDSAAPWEPVPDDGLERYPRSRYGL